MLLTFEKRSAVVAIHFGDKVEADFFGANGFAGAGHGAVAKTFGVHLLNHFGNTPVFLGLALGEKVQMRNFGRDEEHG